MSDWHDEKIKVFISYSHDSEEHRKRVLGLSDKLCLDGIDCNIDQYIEHRPPKSWPQWMLNEIQTADYVLTVWNETYKRRFEGEEIEGTGKGAKWEGAIITQEVYDNHGSEVKFIPIVFASEDVKYISSILRGTTHYNVSDATDYGNLYRHLCKKPLTPKPLLGPMKPMPPIDEKSRLKNAFAIGAFGDKTGVLTGDVPGRSSHYESLVDSAAGLEQSVDVAAVLKNVVKKHGCGAEVAYGEYVPMLDMPQLVKRASMRNETAEELLNTVRKHVWTAINGECGCGKTQLAVLLAKKHGNLGGWLGLRDVRDNKEAGMRLDAACNVWSGKALQTNRRDWYNEVCKHFVAGSVLIIDDMPRLDGNDELSVRLALLAEACGVNNVKLVSTSNFELPTQLIAQIGGDGVADIDIPHFNNTDVKELFEAYGAPVDLLIDKFLLFFNTLARGNATLLAAMATYLESKKWAYTIEEFNDLVKGSYTGKVDEEIVIKFVKTVEDSDSRELLYRLRLAIHSFTYEDVKAVAAVKPVIKRPLEKLQLLVGLWVQREAKDRYIVSPLIKRLQSSDLEPKTERGTYLVLAHRIMSIMRKRNIDQWEAQQAVMYFYLAGAYQNAALVLLMALRSMVDIERPFEDAFLSLFWLDQELPKEINLGLRICLRSMQICICEKKAMDTSYLLTDLVELSQKSSEDEAWAVFMAATTILTKTKVIEKEPVRIYGLLTQAMKFLPEGKLPDGSKFELSGQYEPEIIIWISANTIQNAEHLLCWIRMLEELSSEQREKAFGLEEVDELSIVVANKLFLCEFNKTEESQDWGGLLELLDEFADRVAALELWWLWACVNYTKMIVLSEHMDQFGSAIKLAEKVLEKAGSDPRVSFLIHQYIGRQYYYDKNFDDAHKWLTKALEQETKIEKIARLKTLLCLSNIIGEKNPLKSIKLAEQAVQLAESMPGSVYNKCELVNALAELAIAKWLAVDVTAAFEVWDKAGEHLLDCKNDNEHWKSLFMGYGHVCGYFSHLASYSEPIDKMIDGQLYARPWRGMFVGDYLKRADAYVVGRESLIMVQISNFAEAVGNDNRAIYWALRATEAGQTTKRPVAVSMVAPVVIANNILQSRYCEAIELALYSAENLIAGAKLGQNGISIFDAEFSAEEVLGNKPNEAWKQAEIHALSQSLIPITFKLLTIYISDKKLAGLHSDQVVKKCRSISKKAVDSLAWEKASELFEGMFTKRFRAQDMYRLAKEFNRDYFALNWISYLGLCVVDDVSLKEMCNSQISIIPLTSKIFTPNSITFRSIILPFLLEFWTKKLKFGEQRFRFGSPYLVDKSLKDSEKIPETKRAQAILRAVVDGLNLRVESDIRKWLNS
jgi:hypothetical protein